MFQYFDAHHSIEGIVWLGKGRDVADGLQARLIPVAGLQAGTVPGTIVLVKTLADEVRAGAEASQAKEATGIAGSVNSSALECDRKLLPSSTASKASRVRSANLDLQFHTSDLWP